jgi:F0F1-type ATP synthase delta subunit
VAHAMVLLAVVFIIKKLLLSDTMQAVKRIRQAEADVRKREESIRQDIENHEKEFVKKKAEAEEELLNKRQQSEKEVARLRDQIIDEAKQEAERVLQQARRDEDKLKRQFLQEVEEKTVEYGGEVFKLVFSERMNEQLNNQFIEELLDALEEVDAATITVDSTNAEFVASHPIGDEQRRRLESLLAEKFGAEGAARETIDESLLAGLVFKVGSLEIDGSLRNRFLEAAEEVKKTIQV